MEYLQGCHSISESPSLCNSVNGSFDSYVSYIKEKRAEFSHFAPQYDLQTVIASLGRIDAIRRTQADMAVGKAKGTALDLCCGTGVLTAELATRFNKVIGVDLSPDMLSYAKKRIERQKLVNVDLMESEVSMLQFPDHFFASISISLGMHELPNWLKRPLLKKSVRWLKPGGRYVVCDYRKHEKRLGQFIFRTFARTFIEPKLYDEHMAFDLHKEMNLLGLERVELSRSFLSFFEMCAWSPAANMGSNH